MPTPSSQSRHASASRASTCSELCRLNVQVQGREWWGRYQCVALMATAERTHPTCSLGGLRFAICSLRAHSSACDGYGPLTSAAFLCRRAVQQTSLAVGGGGDILSSRPIDRVLRDGRGRCICSRRHGLDRGKQWMARSWPSLHLLVTNSHREGALGP